MEANVLTNVIRKTDSKGRLVTPWKNEYVKVSARYGEIHGVLISEPIKEVKGALPEKALEYIRSLGLDPKRVSKYEAYPEGFWYFAVDDAGKRIWDYGVSKKERRPWPEGFDWDEFVLLCSESS